MRLLNGNAFSFVAYIGFYCLHSVFFCLATSAIFVIGLSFFSHWKAGPHLALLLLITFLGGLLGRASKLYFFLGGLLHPEETSKRLEKVASGEPLD
jgi:hypothetical protein